MPTKSHLKLPGLAKNNRAALSIRAFATGLATMFGGWLLLRVMPQLAVEFFARGSALLAGLFSGAAVIRVDEGWMLVGAAGPAVVTAACSATDYFLIVAALLGWQCARSGRSPWCAALMGLCAALPLTLGLNALRVVVVMQAHRWIIPQLPDAYGHFLHMLAGIAVFLPALIALNLLLESHGRIHIRPHHGE